MNSYAEAKERIPTQREKIVNMLKEAGEKGVTNQELVKVALRYGARLSELYQRGYDIEVETVPSGYKYILRKEPGDIKYFTRAEDEIMGEIDQHYGGSIKAKELKTLLDSKYFHIIRRNGWWQNGGKANE